MKRRGDRRARPGSSPARVERVEISAIAAGGEGVGRLADGRAVFVHRTAPGELVEAVVIRERQRWARARLLKVLRPSPQRREAPCPHYVECGGCTIEHLDYPAQLQVKARVVADALERIGGLSLGVPEVVASPREVRYRNRVSFALRRSGAGRVISGFHAIHDQDKVVAVDGQCLLLEEPIATTWDGLRAAWGPDAERLPAGETLRLTLRSTSIGAVSLLVEGGHSRGRPEELLHVVPGLSAIWLRGENALTQLVAGAPGLPETWGDEGFDVSGSVFLQVNRTAAALLEEYVFSLAGEVESLRVVDAYCGIGLYSRRLARKGASAVGIDLDAEAIRAGSDAAGNGAVFRAGKVEDLLPGELPADLLLVNPPRAGLETAVIAAIVAQPPPRMIYISCDPATLARDLKRLMACYDAVGIRCFDLFPQTAHVESVAELALRAARPEK